MSRSIMNLKTPEFSCVPHQRVYNMWGAASQYPCVECGGVSRDWAYDGTDPDQLYLPISRSRNSFMHYSYCSAWPEFYMPMCRSCHTIRDRSAARRELHEYRLGGGAKWKKSSSGKNESLTRLMSWWTGS